MLLTGSRFIAEGVLPWNLSDTEALCSRIGYVSDLKSDHEPRICWKRLLFLFKAGVGQHFAACGPGLGIPVSFMRVAGISGFW